jgi:hypothetical protein
MSSKPKTGAVLGGFYRDLKDWTTISVHCIAIAAICEPKQVRHGFGASYWKLSLGKIKCIGGSESRRSGKLSYLTIRKHILLT